MEIVVIPVGMLQANCYLVYDGQTKEALVIDPGAEGVKLQKEIEKRELKVKYLVNTHGHSDHIGANQYLQEVTGAPLYIHAEDSAKLTDERKNLSVYMDKEINKPAANGCLQDGDVLEVGSLRWEVRHTPGHTEGGICLVGEGVCFSGDTLFAGSIGRTDLPGGSFAKIISSIKTKLLVLDDQVVVYPGHGPQTSIGKEKGANPYLR